MQQQSYGAVENIARILSANGFWLRLQKIIKIGQHLTKLQYK